MMLDPQTSAKAILSLDEALPSLPQVQLREIIKAVCQIYGVSRADFISSRRDKTFCNARHVYFWVARKFTTCSYPVIGRYCGNRDHSTVMHGAWKVDVQFPLFRERIGKVLETLSLDAEVAA